MAEVFLARQSGLRGFEKLVVIKRILPKRARNGDFITMFLDEARMAADLRHPNVVNVFDINRDAGTYFMAMEFLHGKDVRHILRRSVASSKELPLGVVGAIGASAAAGLHYAHHKKTISGVDLNIVHRDVSPQNIIVGYSGEVKIVDFGIAKASEKNFNTQQGRIKGKYAYMAPEHVRGEVLDGRADMYSLAVVLWELLTRRRMYRSGNTKKTLDAVLNEPVEKPSVYEPSIPATIDDVIMRALDKDREARYADCDAFRGAIEDALVSIRERHSMAEVARYMTEIFADEIENELTLSEERLGVDDVAPSLVLHQESSKTQTRRQRPKANMPAPGPEVHVDEVTDTEVAPPPDFESQTASGSAPVAIDTATPDSPAKQREPRQSSSRRAWIAGGSLCLAAASIGLLKYQVSNKTVRVVVRSEPRGAAIWIDGKDTTKVTPHVFDLRNESMLRVKLRLTGYAEKVMNVRVGEGDVVVKLEPESEKGRNRD